MNFGYEFVGVARPSAGRNRHKESEALFLTCSDHTRLICKLGLSNLNPLRARIAKKCENVWNDNHIINYSCTCHERQNAAFFTAKSFE